MRPNPVHQFGFLPFAKIDPEQRMVYGWASTPTLDLQGERVSLDAVKAALPDYLAWSNIREMHLPSAVGVCTLAEIVEDGKLPDSLPGLSAGDKDKEGLFIGAKVVDEPAWTKVREGVYKGFSLGGTRLSKRGNLVTAIKLHEISLVDRPANPDCRVTLTKALGLEEVEPLVERQTTFLAALLHKLGFGEDGFSRPAGAASDEGGSHAAVMTDRSRPQVLNSEVQDRLPTATPLQVPGDMGGLNDNVPGQHVSQADALSRESFTEPSTGNVVFPMAKDGIVKVENTHQKTEKVGPPGWSGTIEHMEEHPEISNPWALAWWMEEQGYEPHEAPEKAAAAGPCNCLKRWEDYNKALESGEISKTIRHEGSKWVLYDSEGKKKLGTHDSKDGALAQERAIQANKSAGPGWRAFIRNPALANELEKVSSPTFLTTSVANLAVLYDQVKQIEQDLRYEAAREGGDEDDESLADEVRGLLAQIGALVARAASHEVDEEKAEKVIGVLVNHGITEEGCDMAENIFKRYGAEHKHHAHRALHHIQKAVGFHKLCHTHHGHAHAHLGHAHALLQKARELLSQHFGKALDEHGPCKEAMEHLHKALEHHAKIAEHHGHLAGALEDMGEHHTLAHAHLQKVTSGWVGEKEGIPGACAMDTGVQGRDSQLSQAHLAEGGGDEYDAFGPYPKTERIPDLRTGKAAGNGDGDGQGEPMNKREDLIPRAQAEAEKRIAVLEAENTMLKRAPTVPKGVAFDLNKLVDQPSGSPEARQLVGDLLKGIDTEIFDLNNVHDRSRLVSGVLSNMNKNAAFARSLADPNFKPSRSGRSPEDLRGRGMILTTPRVS